MSLTPSEFVRLHRLKTVDLKIVENTSNAMDAALYAGGGSLDDEGRPVIRVDLGQTILGSSVKFVLTCRWQKFGWLATFSENRGQTLVLLTVKT